MSIFNLEYINEAKHEKEISTCNNAIENFYLHAIKWVYQPNRQGISWIRSMMHASKDLEDKVFDSKGNPIQNIYNGLNGLHDLYIEGLKGAIAETKLDIVDDSEYIFSTFHSFKTVEKYGNIESIGFLDRDKIREWLIIHAYDQSKVRLVENNREKD